MTGFFQYSWSAEFLGIRIISGNELYAGIDVLANGYNTGVSWNSLYCPNWTYTNSSSLSARLR
ncbi:hypothetical protein DRQ21_10770 [Candidatus Fermentibacteria bacterium]|nr:MAG: hypothetical protein DRQ21_10770 [Candidatus Fermentibacteria bacterium]